MICSNFLMENQLNNALRKDMAFAFWDDARDLRQIFTVAWAAHENFNKTGRIKIALNLVMACECALKAHVILSKPEAPPEALLKTLKQHGHNIKKLAQSANYMKDRKLYAEVDSLLESIGVEVRYSLNAENTYFRSDSSYSWYTETIANPGWMNRVRSVLDVLIDECTTDLTGPVSLDWHVEFLRKEAFDRLMNRTGKA